jgi:16S rRNA (cytosine967-C5)-methyltransferase
VTGDHVVASDPRKIALKALNNLEKSHKTLDKIFEAFVDPQKFSGRDRALLNALVYGVLRWRGRLDFIISFFSTTRLNKIDPKILNVLRLGLFQIIYMNRIPNSAAVDTSVELAKSAAAPWVAGFVNAILRNAAAKFDEVPFPDQQKDPANALAAEKSYPAWLIKRWISRFGFQAVAELCEVMNRVPPISIRTNTLKTTRPRLMAAIKNQVADVRPTVYAPDGITFHNPQSRIANLDAFTRGWFQVQDEAAQLVTLLLDPNAGESILDACAGLGGKTGHIAQQMNNRGKIVALDSDAQKLAQLDAQMDRLGVSIVETHCHDLDDAPRQKIFGIFDRILLDAPCTGLGVLRRNPDIKWNASKKDWKRYSERQIRLLGNVAPLVKVSGILVYAVCSVEPEENEAVIHVFLRKNAGFALDRDPGKLPQEICLRAENAVGIKTYPHLKSMDGFFMARLKRVK